MTTPWHSTECCLDVNLRWKSNNNNNTTTTRQQHNKNKQNDKRQRWEKKNQQQQQQQQIKRTNKQNIPGHDLMLSKHVVGQVLIQQVDLVVGHGKQLDLTIHVYLVLAYMTIT
jgi:hypothetical protein